MSDELKALQASKQNYPMQADEGLLETFSVDARGELSLTVDMPEFTCLCPITGQPDYARFTLEYKPNDKAVESKSLKLYLGSFRQTGEFHERVTMRIGRALVNVLKPQHLVLRGSFNARGGIGFNTVYRYVE